jgi:rhamnose transport system ATP-binding protein
VPAPLLQAAGITKTFGAVQALRDVSFDLWSGEVHALVGENGAGKSTLIKVITGAESPDAGTLSVGGTPIRHMDPPMARALGIAAIYQQPALFPDLTVVENIALPLERSHGWRAIDWNGRRSLAGDLLRRVGASIDPDRLVESLSMPEQQLVEIAKAVGADARILIMDEPTAALTDREVDTLFGVVRRLRSDGVGIVYISHRFDEVFAIADRITVLRDGQTAGTVEPGATTRAELIRLMVGREVLAVYPKRSAPIGPAALDVRHVSSRAAGIRDVSLTVRRGEIVGLAGLVGSGRTQLAETLFGLTPADAGEILIDGETVTIADPREAIAAGLAYVPEDRRRHGVVMAMSVAANTSLASLDRTSRRGLLDRAAERRTAEEYVGRFRIRTPSVLAEVGTLSGGNQQKVALARWLATSPSVLILDEPTQGVDVGSKAEIHGLIQELAGRGMAILMISSELPEILGLSNRIAVMHAGTVRAVLGRDEATQSRVLALALGAEDGTEGRLAE